MDDRVWGVLLIIMWLIPMPGGIWYLVHPKGVRKFHKDRPWHDRYGRMKKSADWEIRMKGIIILLVCSMCAGCMMMLLKDSWS